MLNYFTLRKRSNSDVDLAENKSLYNPEPFDEELHSRSSFSFDCEPFLQDDEKPFSFFAKNSGIEETKIEHESSQMLEPSTNSQSQCNSDLFDQSESKPKKTNTDYGRKDIAKKGVLRSLKNACKSGLKVLVKSDTLGAKSYTDSAVSFDKYLQEEFQMEITDGMRATLLLYSPQQIDPLQNAWASLKDLCNRYNQKKYRKLLKDEYFRCIIYKFFAQASFKPTKSEIFQIQKKELIDDCKNQEEEAIVMTEWPSPKISESKT